MLQGKKRVAPGIWIDTEGHYHFSIPELLDHFGWPHDEEHRKRAEQALRELARKFGAIVVKVTHCPNCGASESEPHAPHCALRSQSCRD